MATFFSGSISAFTVGGSSFLCEARNVSYTSDAEIVDGSCLTNLSESPQEVKRSASLQFSNLTTISNALRVSHLDLTGLTLDGDSFPGQIREVSITQNYASEPTAGIGASWVAPQVVKRGIEISIQADAVTDGFAQAAMVDFHSGTYANRNVTFSMVVNGLTITIPCRITGVEYSVAEASLQSMTLSLQGLAPDSGTYITSPTTSTTLLGKAFNAFTTPVSVVFTPSVDNFSISGDFIFSSAAIRVADNELVTEDYTLSSTGTITVTAN